MLGKTTRPVIEIFTGSLVSGHWSGQVEAAASPRSQSQSPRGRKSFDFGGVGLGIVAALERSGGGGNQSPANKALFGRNLSRSNPIPVSSPKNSSRNRRCLEEVSVKTESMEEYTIVTCHGPNKSYTKVYSDVGEGSRKGYQNTPYRIQGGLKSKGTSVFSISPARHGEAIRIPASDFLSSCNLCHKKLHGKDIFMYRGEKAFCSTECRYRQMVIDERTENCSSEASRPVDVAGSPYSYGQIFTTGILAT